MGRARDFEGNWCDHTGSGRLCLWNGYDRGRPSSLITPSVGGSPDIRMVPQAFTGSHPLSEFAAPAINSKISDGKLPTRSQEARELGLTDSAWDVTVRCWRQDPAQRPTMAKVVRLLREWPVFSLSRWNQHRDVLPTATGWSVCGLKSRISQSGFSSTGFYPSVKARMCFRSDVPTSSSP